jgi:hypothetical protein
MTDAPPGTVAGAELFHCLEHTLRNRGARSYGRNRVEEERSDSKSWVVMKICFSLEKLDVPAWFFMTVCVWHHSISPGRAVKISKDMLWGSNIWFNGNASRGRASCYIQGVFFKERFGSWVGPRHLTWARCGKGSASKEADSLIWIAVEKERFIYSKLNFKQMGDGE